VKCIIPQIKLHKAIFEKNLMKSHSYPSFRCARPDCGPSRVPRSGIRGWDVNSPWTQGSSFLATAGLIDLNHLQGSRLAPLHPCMTNSGKLTQTAKLTQKSDRSKTESGQKFKSQLIQVEGRAAFASFTRHPVSKKGKITKRTQIEKLTKPCKPMETANPPRHIVPKNEPKLRVPRRSKCKIKTKNI
jgi:hypothetical protein